MQVCVQWGTDVAKEKEKEKEKDFAPETLLNM